MHKVILDTDIGTDVDDALALCVLLGSRTVDLIGITTVYGDTQLRSRIAMHICELAEKSIDTYLGGSLPISGREVWMSGREGKNYKNLNRFNPKSLGAVEYLIETIASNRNSIDIIAIGPLTNIAKAIQESKDFEQNVKRIWIMGGDFTQSRVEHNFKCDIDAARIVLESKIQISILDLPSSQKTIIRSEEIQRIGEAHQVGPLLHSEIMSWIQPRNQDWTIPHDPITALALIAPEFFETSLAGVARINVDGMSFWSELETGNVQLLNPIHSELAIQKMIELITN